MMAYSKAIGALVGGVLSWLVMKYGLPADWANENMVAAVSTVITAAMVYLFPANKA